MGANSPFAKLIGMALGNYRLDYFVEQHKWGPIFLASDKAGKWYIIRFVGSPTAEALVNPAPDTPIIRGFQQEANQITFLQHPNILPLLDYGDYHGLPYLVYPNVQFVPLRVLLKQHAQTNMRAVGRYLDQVATVLEYSHAQSVPHGNLSTNCIYVQNNRQIVVAEFGMMRMHRLSKEALQPGDMSSQGYTYDGSSETSSPEQLLGKSIDVSTDVYALGAILYRLITAHGPFDGKTPQEVARQHLYAKVPPISTWRSDLPTDLDHIITKAMAKEPPQRFQRPRALVEAYYQAIEVPLSSNASTSSSTDLVKATRPLSVSSLRTRRKSVSRRRFFTVAGAASGIAVVVAAVLVGEQYVMAPDSQQGTPSGVPKGEMLALAAEVPVNSAHTFPIANQTHPGLLIHLPDNSFVAYNSVCTHAGCGVSYNEKDHLLECPCHGSVFDPAKKAEVVQGPAPAPLTEITIVVNANGSITTG